MTVWASANTLRKLEDVTGAGRAEAVDRLEVVADDGQAPAPARQPRHDVHLQRVDVLVLVDEHVLEAAGDRPRRALLAHQRPPAEQQVVEVEQALLALAGGVGAEHLGQRPGVLLTPREGLASVSRSGRWALTTRE